MRSGAADPLRLNPAVKSEIRATLRLALPLVLAELGWMAMGIVDTMFVGRIGAEALGAVGLGAQIYYAIAICAGGLLLGLDTVISQAHGASDEALCNEWLAQGLWLAAMFVPLVMYSIWGIEPVLRALSVDRNVIATMGPYLRALNWSTPALFAYFALRRYLQSLGIVRPVMAVLVTANLINLAGNWILVLGNLGAPRLGAEGSGWATCISRAYMAIMLAAVAAPHALARKSSWRPQARKLHQLLRLGGPAAGQIGLEFAVFTAATILIGRLSAVALAASQIALVTVSTTYMMPLGISSAAAVRVGHALGRGAPASAGRAGWAALGLGAAIMALAAIALLSVPGLIARWFTPAAEVTAAAAVILRVAAFFQLFDGLQVVATGALRGAGDTRTPALCHFAGYWLVGLPVGAALCFRAGWGAPGMWTGLCAGLIVIGTVLALVWRRTARRWSPAMQGADAA
jgi:MATE family multidrug resistance protein